MNQGKKKMMRKRKMEKMVVGMLEAFAMFFTIKHGINIILHIII